MTILTLTCIYVTNYLIPFNSFLAYFFSSVDVYLPQMDCELFEGSKSCHIIFSGYYSPTFISLSPWATMTGLARQNSDLSRHEEPTGQEK